MSWTNTAHPAVASAHKEESWLKQASILVLAAQGTHADATQFNKDVRESRAQLRGYMQQARKTRLSKEHRQLHSTMVLLDVLLKSAAACQTAGYIVCPPLLMIQLKTVLKNAYANLENFKQTLNKTNTGTS